MSLSVSSASSGFSSSLLNDVKSAGVHSVSLLFLETESECVCVEYKSNSTEVESICSSV